MELIVKRLTDTGENMVLEEKENTVMALFPAFRAIPWVRHGCSTRLGGVSQGIYASMNFKEDGEDPEAHVRENYRRIARFLGCDVTKMARASLVHGDRVHLVEDSDLGNGIVRKSRLFETDGLITNRPGVTLAATFADCVPLYFVDRKNRAVGLSHSGWRGTVLNIGVKTLKAMEEAFGARPEEVEVGIGPCICRECYEVGTEVAGEFEKQFKGKGVVTPKENGKYLLDLRKANEQMLLEAGILKEHLHISDLCTACNPDILFSHRASKGKRGALGAFLGIAEDAE